jgi:hypothetical protein
MVRVGFENRLQKTQCAQRSLIFDDILASTHQIRRQRLVLLIEDSGRRKLAATQ